MSDQTVNEVIVLVADVTASVELYERLGNTEAFATIAAMLDRLRAAAEGAGGRFVQSRGDDVLCVFDEADHGAAAAAAMLEAASTSSVALHVALHAGEAITARESIFGDCINVTYRLAAIANTNEALASTSVVERLTDKWRTSFRPLRSFHFKGKAEPIEVYAYDSLGSQWMTQLPGHLLSPKPKMAVRLSLTYGGTTWEVGEAESLSVGRSDEVDIVVACQWVSRRHALIHVRDGVAMLTDRSSYGSFVSADGNVEVRVRRTSLPLSGSGVIGLGCSVQEPESERLEYAVARAGVGVTSPA
ncbi:FHA domain-containing protein [Acuticoccus sp. MNP-M23]|uniref:FHA domain-containing protein n=1 Tax=Acuticoccus sp. MNP-M23 TaxID=3072793 RepID=UPI002815B938|nr:FHA domain-containing protein [Acuticoccus sp. MNP-M23]WMS41714.1 FHA domain-containing protein [Acuticoccus sp. MNP-M23]